MNDRFKFRVWFTPEYDDNEMIYDAQATYDNACEGKGSFHHCTFQEVLDDKNCVVMQCTGMKDKNGKLIYEGDIVRFAEYEIDEIKPEWQYTEIVWGGKYDYPAFDLKDNPFENNGLCELCACGWVVEVVGNIYENKELLECQK